MNAVVVASLAAVRDSIRCRADLEAELLVLRQQVLVLQRQRAGRRTQLRAGDRFLWMALARLWSRWPEVLIAAIRDRDGSYGAVFPTRVEHLGLKQVVIAPRSPWQNA